LLKAELYKQKIIKFHYKIINKYKKSNNKNFLNKMSISVLVKFLLKKLNCL